MDETVAVRRAGGVVVAVLRGEYDVGNAAALRRQLTDLLRQRPAGLVIDLSQVSFCDLACLRTLVALRRRAEALGTWIRLAAPPPLLRRTIDLTGLGGSLPVFGDVEAAFRGRRAVPVPAGVPHLATA
jgi:anti-sigma B factor antagonist